MKPKSRPRFDAEALRELAGAKVFARGMDYHRDGLVQILAIEPARVLARVQGTEEYRAVVTGRGTKIGGECSCPAFEDWGFCKHMVAVALTANDADDDAEATGADTLGRIRQHLKAKGVDALVQMILDLAALDLALFRKLELAATITQTDDKTLAKRLTSAIDTATRVRGFVSYEEAPGWASGVDTVLDTLEELASGARAGVALDLAERAIDRIEQAVANIDDSDGHCGGLLEHAREIHLAAATASKPEPVAFARKLFAREIADGYGTFRDATRAYADVLGEVGGAEYRRLATEAWNKLPALQGRRSSSSESRDYGVLQDILDVFAEREGDLEARIALRTKELTSTWHYLQLAEFCLSQGREAEALRRAEDGLFLFEDQRPDERLVFFVADLLAKAGRTGDAEARLWQAFERAPSLELYTRLRKLAGTRGCERAIALLQARAAATAAATRSHYPAELLIRILVDEKRFADAWAAVQAHGASLGTREALAKASEKTHRGEALAVYAERVAALANTGGNPAYAEAAALIARMAGLRSSAEHASYLLQIKTRFRQKRNFMALLK
jgi:uncharacterized Zn finger protein